MTKNITRNLFILFFSIIALFFCYIIYIPIVIG